MSGVRILGRLWIAALALAFACALSAAVVPAFAAEGAASGDQVAVGTDDTGNATGDAATGGSDDKGESAQQPGQDTPPANGGDTPTEGDGPTTGDGQDVPGTGDNSGANTGVTGDDTQNDQDKNDQDTPSEPEQPAEPEPSYEDTHANMYRLYNPNSGEHFYTMDMHEATSVAGAGWQWEGIGWVSPLVGTPVYRLYNPNAGDHHYTTDLVERDTLVGLGWSDEGIGWYSDGEDHTAVLRQYNPNAVAGSHNFTVSWVENDSLVGAGWSHEGVAWYATNGPALAVQARWLVTSAWGSLERYWIGADGSIARGRFVEADEGAGYTAYARPDGAIVRGAHEIEDYYVVVADQEGRVASTDDGQDGWIVTDAYEGGMQRYYYSAERRAMKGGFFTVGDDQYYGRVDKGCVLRGKFSWNNLVLLADDDGHLATGTGWMVTDRYDGGMQRYWMTPTWEGSGYSGALTGIIEVDGGKYYGAPGKGYVERNRYVFVDRWYTANDDGWLTESVSPEEGDMLLRAQGFSSPTDYLLLVDTNTCRFGIFRGGKDNWNLESFNKCVCGAPWSPTITGTYSTGYHLPVLPDWSNALYCTNITGGYFFHSVLGSTSELGQHLSHGCIRLDWPLAQYVQSIPYGSTVHLY